MSELNPTKILSKLSKALPSDCKENIVIIGSLAAAYAFFSEKEEIKVQTKDIDCLLRPKIIAPEKAAQIMENLLNEGWSLKKTGEFNKPGTKETPDQELPAIRLYPPGMDQDDTEAWFLELLTEPDNESDGKKWTRVIIGDEHYGLPSFRFLSIVTHDAIKINELGISYAKPSMLALANLLEHPYIKPELMKGGFVGRNIKRSNKDLGRVLALGYLQNKDGRFDFGLWGKEWKTALHLKFPKEAKELISRIGDGLKALLKSEEDFDEALYTCSFGLLSSENFTSEALKATGIKILAEACTK